MLRPQTKYVTVRDTDVAYQVLGDGSPDLLYCFGLGHHVDLAWDLDSTIEFWKRLERFGRPIIFDRRGAGASHGQLGPAMTTWEEWAEDIGAVLDAVESTEAVLMADLDAGPFAILFAALHPERVKALVLANTGARYLRADDYQIGVAPEAVDALVEFVAESWGTPEMAVLGNPSLSIDDERTGLIAKLLRASATPRAAAAQYDYILRHLDVRQALPLIQAPTLVFHSRDNILVPIELSRYLADHIAGAVFVELPGSDVGLASTDFLAEVVDFLTGERPPVEIERVLTTVLFTDICNSTERASSMEHSHWKSLLDAHDRAIREQLRRFRGREIQTTGDGFVVSFDGPARAIRCAQAITEAIRALGIEVRAGLHTGECGVRGENLGGLAVHIASRVGSMARAGEVLVSGTVKDLVIGSAIEFDDRGDHQLKGVPGTWRLFAVRR
jgi:class 3 adenylate cyclase